MTPLALNQQEAAETLSVSVNTFKAAVAPHVKCHLIAGMKRWRPEDLDTWLKKQCL